MSIVSVYKCNSNLEDLSSLEPTGVAQRAKVVRGTKNASVKSRITVRTEFNNSVTLCIRRFLVDRENYSPIGEINPGRSRHLNREVKSGPPDCDPDTINTAKCIA